MSETLKGIRRSIGTAQEGKAPLLTSDICRILASCPETLSGLRDRALILVGFAGAFRRSELAAIDFTPLSFTLDGLVIDLRRSTTAQEARNPQRDLPIGIITSLVICTVLYVSVAAVLTGMVPWQLVNIGAPLTHAFLDHEIGWASDIITCGELAGLT